MDLNQITNQASLNIEMFKNNKNLSAEEQSKVLSIFNNVDNKQNDNDNTKGLISGKAIAEFYNNLKSEFGAKYNEFLHKAGLPDTIPNSQQENNYEHLSTITKGEYAAEIFKDSIPRFYIKFDDSDNYQLLKSKSEEEAFGEASSLLSQKIDTDKVKAKEKELNAPKPYTYRGIKVLVTEIKYNTKGERITEGRYNFSAIIYGSRYDTESKEELEKWIDKKLKQLKADGMPIPEQ